ncbi:MAG: CpaF family protein [Lachnospiraceae bacterium]|nr:CpaF family protein [Lachnospiraceae bacterium]
MIPEEIKKALREEVLSGIAMDREMTDDEVMEIIDRTVVENGKRQGLSLRQKQELSRELFYSIRRLDILQELTDDPKVTEIMINGYRDIFIERAGRLYKWDKCFESKRKLSDVIQQIVARCNRTVNESSPIVDARLENGSRVNIVLDPVALNGPIVTIRRFPERPYLMKDLIAFGALDEETAAFIEKLVRAKYSCICSGGTGSGKTTFLNAMSDFIPKDERIITIEDSAELQIVGVDNLVRLETRNANVEGCEEITIRDLIRSSLRMRPDRLIIGEVRGAETVDLLQCLNTGHDGSLSTIHANSAADMVSRLETMVLMGMDLPLSAVRGQIASGVDIIVQLGRLRDKSRKVIEIAEVTGLKNDRVELSTLYRFKEEGEDDDGHIRGRLVRENKLIHTEKLRAAGIG